MVDFFPRMAVKPNPECDEANCRLRQKEFQVAEEKRKREAPAVDASKTKVDDAVVHEDNDWGISLVADDYPNPSASDSKTSSSGLQLVEGVRVSANSVLINNNLYLECLYFYRSPTKCPLLPQRRRPRTPRTRPRTTDSLWRTS
jgi:hypothetical protein